MESFAESTHEVFNQPCALENFNAWRADEVLRYWVERFDGQWAADQLSDYGSRVGGDLIKAGFDANKFKPEFVSHSRFGERIDLVEFHPSYHELMKTALEAGHHSLPWTKPQPGANVARAAFGYLHAQADAGTGSVRSLSDRRSTCRC